MRDPSVHRRGNQTDSPGIPKRGSEGVDLSQISKEEAHREAIRRWHTLPVSERRTEMHARVFAAGLVDELDFHTMGNRRRVIEAWLFQDIAEAH